MNEWMNEAILSSTAWNFEAQNKQTKKSHQKCDNNWQRWLQDVVVWRRRDDLAGSGESPPAGDEGNSPPRWFTASPSESSTLSHQSASVTGGGKSAALLADWQTAAGAPTPKTYCSIQTHKLEVKINEVLCDDQQDSCFNCRPSKQVDVKTSSSCSTLIIESELACANREDSQPTDGHFSPWNSEEDKEVEKEEEKKKEVKEE